MRLHRIFVSGLILLPLLSLANCGGGGPSNTSTVNSTSVSQGQQLIDLKAALDKGVITQSEYNTQRSKILNAP